MSEPLRGCPHCGPKTTIDVNSIQLVCLSCGLHGPVTAGQGEDCTAAIAAWNHLPRHLCWTTKTPTKPDFYWHRDEGILSIAYIFGDTQDNLLCHFAGEEHPTPLILITGEWAGPIPEPQEQP